MATSNGTATGGPITIIVILRIKPENVARVEELWHEQIADIDNSEPAGNIKYSLFCNNAVLDTVPGEHEYVVVQEYVCLNYPTMLVRFALCCSAARYSTRLPLVCARFRSPADRWRS